MAKKGISRTRAIQNTLARLGMQASPKQVVAALAEFGIDVNEGLVRQVKVDLLKQAAKSERQRVRTPQIERPQVRRPLEAAASTELSVVNPARRASVRTISPPSSSRRPRKQHVQLPQSLSIPLVTGQTPAFHDEIEPVVAGGVHRRDFQRQI